MKKLLIFSLFAVKLLVEACMPQMSQMRRSGSTRSRTPLIFGQYIPNRSELSLSASGSSEPAIIRDTPEFVEKLTENHNVDIIFKDEEESGADRFMTQRCKDKLDSLAIMVMNQWQGIKLRVIEAWDEDNAHASDSLHYEGRAVDITTSDRDKTKLGILARLAYDAGFDWVYYESRNHIHASVKSDNAQVAVSSGCFSGESLVTLQDQTVKAIKNIKLGEKVQTYSPDTGMLLYSEVFMFLDKQVDYEEDFLTVKTDLTHITVTKSHLIFRQSREDKSQTETIFAKDLIVGDFIYTENNGTITISKIESIYSAKRRGVFAPLTHTGTILVNNVAASCYAGISSHHLAHWSLWPMRQLHHWKLLGDSPMAEEGVHWYAVWLSKTFTSMLSSMNMMHT